MSLLFTYRQIFHSIAAKDVPNGTIIPTTVCWVDLLLSKLGDIIVSIARGSSTLMSSATAFSSLEKQRESDALRVATQLPGKSYVLGIMVTVQLFCFEGKWMDVHCVLSAQQASPAVQRLALQLIFGVYVMGPQIGCVLCVG